MYRFLLSLKSENITHGIETQCIVLVAQESEDSKFGFTIVIIEGLQHQ